MDKDLLGWFRRFPAWSSACAGGGIGVMSNIMTNHWPGAPTWVLSVFFWVGLFLFLVPIPTILLWSKFYRGDRNVYRILFVLLYWVVLFIPLRAAERSWSNPPQADLKLCVVNETHPQIVIFNSSDQVSAENGVYSSTFYNLDNNSDDQMSSLSLSSINLRPLASSVTWDLLASGATAKGTKIVGTVGITCPKCKTGRTYWVSMTFGESGWYALDKGEAVGGSMQWVGTSRGIGPSAPQVIKLHLDQIPEKERVPIRSLASVIVDADRHAHLMSVKDCAGHP